MWFKPQSKTVLDYTVYAIVGTVLELLAFFIVVLWILPLLNIWLQWEWIVVILVVLLGIDVFTYIMGRRALSKRLTFVPEFIVGSIGTVATPLNPTGYVKVKGELWKASCESKLEVGDEVVVREMEGMKLIVVPNSTRNR